MKVLHFIFAIILKTKLIWLALFLTIYLNPRKKVDGKKTQITGFTFTQTNCNGKKKTVIDSMCVYSFWTMFLIVEIVFHTVYALLAVSLSRSGDFDQFSIRNGLLFEFSPTFRFLYAVLKCTVVFLLRILFFSVAVWLLLRIDTV